MPSDDMERAAGAYAKDMRKLRQSAIDDMDRARELLGFGDTGGAVDSLFRAIKDMHNSYMMGEIARAYETCASWCGEVERDDG